MYSMPLTAIHSSTAVQEGLMDAQHADEVNTLDLVLRLRGACSAGQFSTFRLLLRFSEGAGTPTASAIPPDKPKLRSFSKFFCIRCLRACSYSQRPASALHFWVISLGTSDTVLPLCQFAFPGSFSASGSSMVRWCAVDGGSGACVP